MTLIRIHLLLNPPVPPVAQHSHLNAYHLLLTQFRVIQLSGMRTINRLWPREEFVCIVERAGNGLIGFINLYL